MHAVSLLKIPLNKMSHDCSDPVAGNTSGGKTSVLGWKDSAIKMPKSLLPVGKSVPLVFRVETQPPAADSGSEMPRAGSVGDLMRM